MEHLELDSLVPVYGGMCLSRSEGVIFVKGAIPGERVLVEIIEKKRDYLRAHIVEIVSTSPDRVEPLCPVFGSCGGCHYQHISYKRQLAIKEEILKDCLTRIGKIDFPLTETISGNQWNYRHKAQLKLSFENSIPNIGFYRENTRDIIPIEQCNIVSKPINNILTKLRTSNIFGKVRELDILSAENTIAYLKDTTNGHTLASYLLDEGFNGVIYGSNENDFRGDNHCIFKMDIPNIGNFTYTVSPQGFFQSNWALNLKLIEEITKSLEKELIGTDVLDIYGGAGNFALPISTKASSVTVVEENPFCIFDGKSNIKLNNIKNIRFIAKSFEKAKIDGKYNLVILNPPRRGLSNEAVQKLIALNPNH
ncbi:MAG: methyltransferase, partial [Candidatus Magnetoovum sp. WYHC-5]|nr:methyltransferase [Candidatus Magnetoovum sp. WYHC-5]